MCQYKHLTLFEREKILFLFLLRNSMTAIAIKLRRSKFTISRELRRNTYHYCYIPIKAQEKYQQRIKACHQHKILISLDINQRPMGSADRSRRGHWEADTVVSKLDNSKH